MTATKDHLGRLTGRDQPWVEGGQHGVSLTSGASKPFPSGNREFWTFSGYRAASFTETFVSLQNF
jgi:hypothetical protein